MTRRSVGVDFGTTNTSIAIVDPSGDVRVATFPFLGQLTDAYRSLLYFEQSERKPSSTGAGAAGSGPPLRVTSCWTGPSGIEHYLSAEAQGRLIQSLKSVLAVRDLESTQVFERKRTIEELIGRILADVRHQASRQFGVDIRHATVGRPVRFVGANSADDDGYAEDRLAGAFSLAGFDTIAFELEPIAAAYQYETTLDHDELILIGDFGGGTSDFSLARVGPGVLERGREDSDLLGNAGVAVAGDDFDAQIVRHLVSPALGSGGRFRSMDKLLPMPGWPYSSLERWHHLSLIKTPEVIEQLDRLRAQAVEPKPIAALIHLIEADLGYQLHRSVQRLKNALSTQDRAEFAFVDGDLVLRSTVDRSSFESWIAREIGRIAGCVDGLFDASRVAITEVDAVFLTGGSSLVPAVRRIFEDRFGAHRIRTGQEFTSVAMGLARRGAVA